MRVGSNRHQMEATNQESQPTTDKTDVESFLAAHPRILVGRDALNQAEVAHNGRDTFSIVNKPLANVVLYQEFDSDTLNRLFAVALVNDEEAERYYRKQSGDNNQDAKDDNASTCCRAAAEGAHHFVFDHMIKIHHCSGKMCNQEDCPNVTYMGGNCVRN